MQRCCNYILIVGKHTLNLSLEQIVRVEFGAMFPLTVWGLCAQKYWRVCTFCGNSPRIKAVFGNEIRWRPKKKKSLHPEMERFLHLKLCEDQKKLLSLNWNVFCARKLYCLSDYCNFMINSNMSVQQYRCLNSKKTQVLFFFILRKLTKTVLGNMFAIITLCGLAH